MTKALRYFNIDDYIDLDANERVLVDNWLAENDCLEKISLVQEVEGTSELVLSGPEIDEDGLASEGELVVYKVLEENTFPWEVLKKVSHWSCETQKS